MVYLEKPNTEIEFHNGESKAFKMKYVAAEMQGWRINMVTSSELKPIAILGGRPHFRP